MRMQTLRQESPEAEFDRLLRKSDSRREAERTEAEETLRRMGPQALDRLAEILEQASPGLHVTVFRAWAPPVLASVMVLAALKLLYVVLGRPEHLQTLF